MNTALEIPILEGYLEEIQRLRIASTFDPAYFKKTLVFIKEQQSLYPNHAENESFFTAENAFHNGNYEHALVNYMQAREIPFFEFFCYRATAFVSFYRGNREKAKNFIIKSLDFRPADFDALKLYHEILMLEGAHETANEIKAKIAQIKANGEIEMNREKFSFQEQASGSCVMNETTSHFIATKLGVDLDTEKALEDRIQEFKLSQTKQIQNYLEDSKRKPNSKDHSLYILNGWGTQSDLIGQSHQTYGGFFIRWNGKGIVLNPGMNFLENFHKQGLYIGDIHYVIVTQDSPEANADIKRIYDLNYQLNKISPELHIIDYYLNHKAYQELSHTLKPNFKQERNTVHSLELFLDSPDVESEVLDEGIILNYFSTSTRGGYAGNNDFQDLARGMQASCVGVRLDLSLSGLSKEIIRLGYISGAAWSPLLAHNLGPCDLLIAGFGTTNPNDYGKLNYNENSLGYFGTYTLFEEVKPKLLLCAEFEGREGDIRLEVTRKMRKEYQKTNNKQQPAILPADNGLFIDLKTQNIECSVTKGFLDPKNVIVVKSSDAYGKLQYLSPTCIL